MTNVLVFLVIIGIPAAFVLWYSARQPHKKTQS